MLQSSQPWFYTVNEEVYFLNETTCLAIQIHVFILVQFDVQVECCVTMAMNTILNLCRCATCSNNHLMAADLFITEGITCFACNMNFHTAAYSVIFRVQIFYAQS